MKCFYENKLHKYYPNKSLQTIQIEKKTIKYYFTIFIHKFYNEDCLCYWKEEGKVLNMIRYGENKKKDIVSVQ